MKLPPPLRRYLSIQFLMVAALPVLIIAVLVWLLLIPQMRNSIDVQQQGLARAIAGHISAYLLGGERHLAAVAELLSTQTYADAQVTALLDAHCGDGELFETIFTIAPDKAMIRHVGLPRDRRRKREDIVGLDLSGRPFIQTGAEDGPAFWSETFLSTVSSKMAVAVIVPMAQGTLVGEIILQRLSDFTSHLPVSAGLFILVLDRKGRIVADSDEVRAGQALDMARLPESLGNEAYQPSRTFHLQGQAMIGTMVTIDRLGWNVLVAQPVGSAFRPVRDAFSMLIVGLTVAMTMAIIAALQRAGSISRLMRHYASLAQSIARGQYELAWPVSKTLELHHLAENLKAMAQTISRREDELMASETHLRITLDSIGDGVITTDVNGHVTRINPTAQKLSGWTEGEATGRSLSEIFHLVEDDTRKAVPMPMETVLAGEAVSDSDDQLMMCARDGFAYHISHSISPIRYPDGRIVGVVLVFRDISAGYAQEKIIRDSERRLANLVANVPGVVYQFVATPGRRDSMAVTTMNQEKVLEIFGLATEPEDFFDAFVACLPEEDQSRFFDSIYGALKEMTPWEYEGRFIKPAGEEIWFSGRSVPHATGAQIVYYGVLMDITVRKRLEASLRLTQFCFAKASVGIFRIGEDGEILDVNEQACHSLGYTHAELCRLTVFDIDPDYTPERYAELMEQLRTVRSQTIETRHLKKNGETFPIQIRINVMRYEGQTFMVAFVEDITNLKKSLEELQRLRNYLSNIIDSMPSMLVGVDVDGRVTQWNRQAERATGIALTQAQGSPLATVLPSLAAEMARIGEAIRDHETIRRTKIPRQSDGTTRYEDVTIYPLVANGVDGAVIRVDDVTERVRLEEMMIQSEKMLSVGGLAAGMAHEINNPLAGILQNAAVMENRLLSDLAANHNAAETAGTSMAAIKQYMAERKLIDMLGNIREAGQRAAEIVRNMLSFARKSERLISTHDLRSLLDQTIELVKTDYDMKKQYDFKQIKIVREYADEAVYTPCEASKVQQVLLNILKNGAEAMAEQTDPKASPRFVLRVYGNRTWACIEIEDNGPGMPASVRRRVFEPFFTTKPVGKGTGLGLSVSYFIITEDHGGEMQVRDAEGGGTCFVIRLPSEG